MRDISFFNDNKVTIDTMEYIDKHLKFLGEIYIIPYINMHTVFLKVDGNLLNNNLILVPKGFGKTTFLKAIAESNKDVVTVLPEKMYESMLSKENKEYFNQKILVHYDFITAIFGVDKKQKDQLIGFWTTLLSDGKYQRQSQQNLEGVKCCCMWGMAKESFDKHRSELFESTFLDRLIFVNRRISKEEKKDVFKYRNKRKKEKKEQFVLKLIKSKTKNGKDIKFDPDKYEDAILELVMELDDLGVVTSTRGQDYIYNFLKCNAYINGRDEVNDNDLLMYQQCHSFHLERKDKNKLVKIREILLENPKATYEQIMKKTGYAKGTVWKYIKKIRDDD